MKTPKNATYILFKTSISYYSYLCCCMCADYGVNFDIDMHKAVTKEDNPAQWKDGFCLSDATHPSALGHEAMYKQIEKDVPFIFSK